MTDLQAVQSLLVRVAGIGGLLAAITYVTVRLLVKPWIDVRFLAHPLKGFFVNIGTTICALVLATAAIILTAKGFSWITFILELLLITLFAAGTATFGDQIWSNFRGDKHEGDDVRVGEIHSAAVSIGRESSSTSEVD